VSTLTLEQSRQEIPLSLLQVVLASFTGNFEKILIKKKIKEKKEEEKRKTPAAGFPG